MISLMIIKKKLNLCDRNQLNSNSNEYMWMSCWPACIEEMKHIHIFNWKQYLHHILYQIAMSDLMINVHVTDNTTDTMLYVRSICQR